MTINNGLLAGSGSINGNLTVNSQIVPGGFGASGILTVAGNYTQGANATLFANLGGLAPGTGYGQLNVTGQANLAGTLSVVLINGFALRDGNTFQVLNYNPRAGVFGSFDPQGLPIGASLTPNYTATSLVLSATVVPVLLSIAVTPANPSVAKGLTQQFIATGTYNDGTTANLTNQVTWASANTGVASINASGVATGLAQGSATISATLGSLIGPVTGSTTLTVTPAVLRALAITPADSSLAKGLTRQFAATGTYSDGSTQVLTSQVTWASANTAVATIDAAGLATAAGQGSTAITAAFGSITASTSLTVTPATLVSIAVTTATPTITAGSTATFVATGTYTDATTVDISTLVVWSSSTPSVATISNDAGTRGMASGIAPGTTTIAATLGGASGSTSLTVTSPVAASIGAISASWGTAGTSALATAGDGIRLLPAGRSNNVPWIGVNRFAITLDRSAPLASGDVRVTGIIGVDYGPVTISGSGSNYVITLARPINAADRVTLSIGNAGIATFTRRLDVLPGDVNDDGAVTMQDAMLVRNAYLGFVPTTIALPYLDVLGEGAANLSNYNAIRRLIGTILP